MPEAFLTLSSAGRAMSKGIFFSFFFPYAQRTALRTDRHPSPVPLVGLDVQRTESTSARISLSLSLSPVRDLTSRGILAGRDQQ